MVFAKSLFRSAYRADDPCPQVFFAADPVMDFSGERIEEQPVHSEITAPGIRFRIGEHHGFRPPAIPVIRLGSKSGHLKLLSILNDYDNAELFAHGNRFTEKYFHLPGPGIRGDIKILRPTPEQNIPHAAAHPEGGEASSLQLSHHFNSDVASRGIHK